MPPSIRMLAGAIAIALLLLALRRGGERARWIAALAAVGLSGLAAAADAHWTSLAVAVATAAIGAVLLLPAVGEDATTDSPGTDAAPDETPAAVEGRAERREAARFRLALALLLVATGTFGILLGRRAVATARNAPPPATGAGVVDPALEAELRRVRMLVELDAALADPEAFAAPTFEPDDRATLEQARGALRRGASPADPDRVERLLLRHALGATAGDGADQDSGARSTPSDSR